MRTAATTPLGPLRREVGSVLLVVSDYAARQWMAPHEHAESSVSFVLRGGLEEQAGSGGEHAGVGDLLVKPAGVPHADRFGPDGARLVALRWPSGPEGDDDGVRDVVQGRRPERPLRYGVVHAPRLSAAAARLMRALPDPARDDFDLEDAALELLGRVQSLGARAAPPRRPPWLAGVEERLHLRPDETGGGGRSVAELAAGAGVHPVHLARVFRRLFGTSLRCYRRRIRVQRAAALVAMQPRASLASIAAAAGFADEAHLSRSFRAELACTPGEYRAWIGPGSPAR